MEENNGCVLIKKKDYESLKEKANRTEPKEIHCYVDIEYNPSNGRLFDYKVHSNFSLEDNLRRQIFRIYSKVMDRFRARVHSAMKKRKDFCL
jgi:hypothetical protein